MRSRLIGMLLLIAPVAIMMSCGNDEDPPSGVSFELVSENINESDGTVASFQTTSGGGIEKKIKIVFDRPMAENAVINYTVTGTANKKNVTDSNGNTSGYDYYLDGRNAKDTETLVVNKGDTEAYITLTIFEDGEFEVDTEDASGNYIETVVLTLSSVVSGPAALATDNLTYTLNILEDDALFVLSWEALDSKNDVDIDFVAKTGGVVANASASESTDGTLASGGEGFILPGGYPAGTYNFSYPYYSGTSNNVKFTVYMLNTAGTLNGKSYPYSGSTALSFSGVYTQANIHKYSDFDNFTDVTYSAQTLVKSGINYTTISSITVPASSSRNASSVPALEGISLSNLKLNKEQIRKLILDKTAMHRK